VPSTMCEALWRWHLDECVVAAALLSGRAIVVVMTGHCGAAVAIEDKVGLLACSAEQRARHVICMQSAEETKWLRHRILICNLLPARLLRGFREPRVCAGRGTEAHLTVTLDSSFNSRYPSSLYIRPTFGETSTGLSREEPQRHL